MTYGGGRPQPKETQVSFIVLNGTNRQWTTTEEDTLGSFVDTTPEIWIDIEEDHTIVYSTGKDAYVLVWAVADNLYVATPRGNDNRKIYWSNSLKDVCDFAAEYITLSAN